MLWKTKGVKKQKLNLHLSLNRHFIFFHDTAMPHKTHATQTLLQKFGRIVWSIQYALPTSHHLILTCSANLEIILKNADFLLMTNLS